MKDYTLIDFDTASLTVDGDKQKTYKKQGLTVTIRTNAHRVASIKTEALDYSIDTQEKMIDVFATELKRTIKSLKLHKKRKFMVVGLGNAGMTADSLGVKTLSKVSVTPTARDIPLRRTICTFAPSVMGLTAIDSNDAVLGVTKIIRPDLVILVDTLATSDIDKLARVVQVKNSGMIAGGGVGSDKPALDQAYLGVPVISVGVPLVIYLRHVVATYLDDNIATKKMDDSTYTLVVTPKEIDFTVDYFSTILATALNTVLEEI